MRLKEVTQLNQNLNLDKDMPFKISISLPRNNNHLFHRTKGIATGIGEGFQKYD